MSTYTTQVVHDWATLSDAQSFWWNVHTAIATTGMTQVSLLSGGDTGQLGNGGVITALAAEDNFPANWYELWAFNDSLQSTVPVYIKVSYGTGHANNQGTRGAPAISIQVGGGFNATTNNGTLTGQTLGSIPMANNVETSATATSNPIQNIYVAGNGSYFTMIWSSAPMTASLPATAFGFYIGRILDNNGNITNAGIEAHFFNGSASGNALLASYTFPWIQGGIGFVAPVTYSANNAPYLTSSLPMDGAAAANTSGTSVIISPCFPPGIENPVGAIIYAVADLYMGASTIQVPLLNGTHTYVCVRGDTVANSNPFKAVNLTNAPTIGFGLRYE